jgi:hypothetical protein
MQRSRASEPALEQTNSVPPSDQARARPDEIPTAREAVPPLPPPVTIQPLPRLRAAPRADTAAPSAQTTPPRPNAPRSAPAPGRPLNLLGAQN